LSYVLTDAAETDLRAIIRYTRAQWGEAQVRHYVARLKAGMASVAAGRGVFKPMDALIRNCAWRIVNITSSFACRAKMPLP